MWYANATRLLRSVSDPCRPTEMDLAVRYGPTPISHQSNITMGPFVLLNIFFWTLIQIKMINQSSLRNEYTVLALYYISTTYIRLWINMPCITYFKCIHDRNIASRMHRCLNGLANSKGWISLNILRYILIYIRMI